MQIAATNIPDLRNGLPELVQPISIVPPAKLLLKLDFGCGPNPREGFEGADILPFDGKVKYVLNLVEKWPWEDSSVEEGHASHFLEHLTNLDDRWERVHFFNELYRVLIPGGKCTIIVPYWCSARYYGDPSHKEPFSEWGCYYLNREWRLGNPEKECPCKGIKRPEGLCPTCGGTGKFLMHGNAPHDDIKHNSSGYSCDFDWAYGYNPHGEVANKSQERQQYMLTFCKEAAQDLIITVTARK